MKTAYKIAHLLPLFALLALAGFPSAASAQAVLSFDRNDPALVAALTPREIYTFNAPQGSGKAGMLAACYGSSSVSQYK
jgi:hypothetical protein